MPTLKTKRFANRSDEQLEDSLAQLRDELAKFQRANHVTMTDAVENAETWLRQARSIPMLYPEALAGGGRDLGRDTLTEVVAAYVLTSADFREWLTERAAACGGSSGFSKLSRKDRDEQVDKMKAEIGALETEIVRRGLEAERGRVETELAALVGGEAA